MNRHPFLFASVLFSCATLFAIERSAGAGSYAVETKPACLVITHGGQPVATYVFRDDKIPRPYFAHLHAPDGIQVTRNHPPVAGKDATDHDTLHPGLWLAFGDLNGVDFWRNKGRIEHVRLVREPRIEGGRLSFAVEEKYLAPGGAEVCRGVNEFCFVAGETFQPALPGTLLMWSTTLRRADGPLTFGPQHEMGLGFRIATPLVVKGGTGSIVSSHGGKNEAGNWGRTGSWWNYSGTLNGRHAGVLVLAAPDNSRPVWSHARDYGFLALNPTGPPPGAKDVPSVPFTIPAGESLRLKFGVLLHASAAGEPLDPAKAAPAVSAELKAWNAKASLSKPQDVFYSPTWEAEKAWGEPAVNFHNGTYTMIYDYFPTPLPFGLATSADGVYWRDAGPVFEKCVGGNPARLSTRRRCAAR